MLHFYGNLLYLLVLFFPFYLIAFIDYLEDSVYVKKQFVSVFRSTGASLKKEKKKKSKPCSDRQVL